jgi:hypothetical protein
MYDFNKQNVTQDIIAGCLTIITIIYASHTQLVLPIIIRNLFNNDIFRIIVLSLITIVAGNAKPHVALFVAILFIISMQYVIKNEIDETFFGNINTNNLCNKNENCISNVCIMQEGKTYGLCK